MDSMSLETNSLTLAGFADSLGELLKEHKGQDVAVLDMRKFQTWTDFFIITTVSSSTHMDGLDRHINEFCRERKIEIRSSFRKSRDDQWRLLDLSFASELVMPENPPGELAAISQSGSIIVHLMTSSAREFYDLERLWAVQ